MEDGDSEDDGFNEHEDVKNFRYNLLGDSDLVSTFIFSRQAGSLSPMLLKARVCLHLNILEKHFQFSVWGCYAR